MRHNHCTTRNATWLRQTGILLSLAVLALSLLGARAVNAFADQPEATMELPAGPIAFAGNGRVTTEREIIVLRHDAVRVETVLRAADGHSHPLLIAFALPDIDAAAHDGGQVSILSFDPSNPVNFVGFWAQADGAPVQLEAEQRAMALGMIDVTAALLRSTIPLYPLTADVSDMLTALPVEARDELFARSAVRLNDGLYEPLWTLKTVFHWRQALPPTQALKLTYGYRPVTGSSPWTAETATGLIERFCIGREKTDELTRRAAAGTDVTVRWLTFQSGAASHHRGQAAEYTITAEKPGEKGIVSTCRDGFVAQPDGALRFRAADHAPEDEVLVMFVD
jgi:hypothetical protein